MVVTAVGQRGGHQLVDSDVIPLMLFHCTGGGWGAKSVDSAKKLLTGCIRPDNDRFRSVVVPSLRHSTACSRRRYSEVH